MGGGAFRTRFGVLSCVPNQILFIRPWGRLCFAEDLGGSRINLRAAKYPRASTCVPWYIDGGRHADYEKPENSVRYVRHEPAAVYWGVGPTCGTEVRT
jgi:hypothetical protein